MRSPLLPLLLTATLASATLAGTRVTKRPTWSEVRAELENRDRFLETWTLAGDLRPDAADIADEEGCAPETILRSSWLLPRLHTGLQPGSEEPGPAPVTWGDGRYRLFQTDGHHCFPGSDPNYGFLALDRDARRWWLLELAGTGGTFDVLILHGAGPAGGVLVLGQDSSLSQPTFFQLSAAGARHLPVNFEAIRNRLADLLRKHGVGGREPPPATLVRAELRGERRGAPLLELTFDAWTRSSGDAYQSHPVRVLLLAGEPLFAWMENRPARR